MGLSRFKNCSVYQENSAITATNPNPARFDILEVKQVGRNLVARIKYPDCTNYEGVKICLYKNMGINEILSLSCLDPHFSETTKSPFARFKPNPDGWDAACFMADAI